jgi:hypothetical protein
MLQRMRATLHGRASQPTTLKPSRDGSCDFQLLHIEEVDRALILQELEAADWVIGGPDGAAADMSLALYTHDIAPITTSILGTL